MKKTINDIKIDVPEGMEAYFKSIELAEQAIEILGKETIKFALSTNW